MYGHHGMESNGAFGVNSLEMQAVACLQARGAPEIDKKITKSRVKLLKDEHNLSTSETALLGKQGLYRRNFEWR